MTTINAGPTPSLPSMGCSACSEPMPGLSVLSWVRPPTGEPDAGDPPVRFGGRGRRCLSLPLLAGPVPAIVRPQACNIREVQVPFRNTCFRPVADRNCVIARWCGEQREANGQSVVTRTQFGRADWRASDGKAKPRPAMSGKPATLTGQVTKRSEEAVGCLETESPEGDAREVERPARQRAGDVCQVE